MSTLTTRLGTLDLTQVPMPDALENVIWTDIVIELKTDLLTRYPDAADVIDDHLEPLVYLMQNFAAREAILRASWNDKVRAVLLPTTTGADLDNVAAGLGVERMLIRAQDSAAGIPEDVYEDDERLRRRVQLAPDAFATAGSRKGYIFHALTAHPSVVDAMAYDTDDIPELNPGDVQVAILVDPTADEDEVWNAVHERVNRDDVKPMTDNVTVHLVEQTPLDVSATLMIPYGPDALLIKAVATEQLQAYFAARYQVGALNSMTGRAQALHVPGVTTVASMVPAIDNDPGKFGTFVLGEIDLEVVRT